MFCKLAALKVSGIRTFTDFFWENKKKESDEYCSYQLYFLQIRSIGYKTLVSLVILHQVDNGKRALHKICQNMGFLWPVNSTKKWSFPFRFSSVNVTKYLIKNFIFCAVRFSRVILALSVFHIRQYFLFSKRSRKSSIHYIHENSYSLVRTRYVPKHVFCICSL